jgi:hypothetical protein
MWESSFYFSKIQWKIGDFPLDWHFNVVYLSHLKNKIYFNNIS